MSQRYTDLIRRHSYFCSYSLAHEVGVLKQQRNASAIMQIMVRKRDSSPIEETSLYAQIVIPENNFISLTITLGDCYLCFHL